MKESPRTIPRSGASRSGSGPRRPHELVRLPRSLDGDRRRPSDGLGQLRAIGHEEEHRARRSGAKLPQPDRSRAGLQPVGAARIIGFEDLRRKQQRPVEVAPAEQAMLGIEPGIAHQALVRRRSCCRCRSRPASRLGDALETEASPAVVDLARGAWAAGRRAGRPYAPEMATQRQVTPPRQQAGDPARSPGSVAQRICCLNHRSRRSDRSRKSNRRWRSGLAALVTGQRSWRPSLGISRWTHQPILVNVPKAINGEKQRRSRHRSPGAGGMIKKTE